MQYFISKMFDDVIFRLNEEENELEIYNGKGKWILRPGMYVEYLSGVHSSVWAIDEDAALKIIKNLDKKNFEDETYYKELGNTDKAETDFKKAEELCQQDK